MKQIEELGDKTIGIDIDGDKKPDFKVDVWVITTLSKR